MITKKTKQLKGFPSLFPHTIKEMALRKRNREDGEDDVEKIEDCYCSEASNLAEVVKRLEQRDVANTRIIHELAKDVSDFKNTGMSLINKLLTAMEEQQARIDVMDKRTRNLGRVVKKLKTDEEFAAPELLCLTQQMASLQDLVVKVFAKLK